MPDIVEIAAEVYAQARAAKKLNEIPGNQAQKFAAVLAPTLRTGIEAMPCAADAWPCRESEAA
ncbi:MAG TPA: hypothetical protein VIH96_06285 [Paraburkholderia sp.]